MATPQDDADLIQEHGEDTNAGWTAADELRRLDQVLLMIFPTSLAAVSAAAAIASQASATWVRGAFIGLAALFTIPVLLSGFGLAPGGSDHRGVDGAVMWKRSRVRKALGSLVMTVYFAVLAGLVLTY